MKLSDWAKAQGISYYTAWRWFRDGKLPVIARQTATGTILVDLSAGPSVEDDSLAWIYCRVSSPNKKDDLARQAERCRAFCAANGWTVQDEVKEVASGMNDKRPKLHKLLANNPTRLVVEHKDRLTRFGFGYFEALLPKVGCRLVVINRCEEQQVDLLQDLVSVVTSFCCRLYGARRGKAKATNIVRELS